MKTANNSAMKKILKITGITLLIFLVTAGGHLYYLSTLAAKETYPADTYLDKEPNKRALIIVAHDDDMAGSAGTISMLCESGWKIREMCFYQQGGLYLMKDSIKNPLRKKALQEVGLIQGLEGTDPVQFNFRNDMMTEKSYMPMKYELMPVNYKIDSLNRIIADYIGKYRPSVIFTLDDSIGGYGHPDHVLMARLVVAYCRSQKNDPDFPVKKIYQAVFPPSLSESIMKKNPTYIEAKKVYGCNGMPLPDVQVNIVGYAKQKKKTMLSYTTEQNSLKKIWPYYNWYPAAIYFRIFKRDFFRVLELEKL
jgi:LmbE family N-acetylglucosaminyl deacetylase